MDRYQTLDDIKAIEAEHASWHDRGLPTTFYKYLERAATKFGPSNAVSFQLTSDPTDRAETDTWSELFAKSTQAANMFRDLGIGENDVVAYLLPNAMETVYTLSGGAIAGIVNPINPLLEPEQIASILRETNAKVLVTLKSFVKTDVAQRAAEAVAMAPCVETVLEVDLLRYLSPPKSWIVPFIRPKNPVTHSARVLDFQKEMAKHGTTLAFEDSDGDRVGAYFHTGGTTGMPKVAQHKYSGMVYNGWLGQRLLFDETDTVICPLPLFHVFAVEPIYMSMIMSGAHMVLPTPAGYRGDGVMDNFWKLIERWGVTFVITVPTAAAALMQRPVNADLSTLKTAFSGSAPFPVELYRRFEEATGVTLVEGYGLTEATCLVSCNPPSEHRKVGSVGIPFPHTDIKIVNMTPDGPVECAVDEIGEICVQNAGVFAGNTYTETEKNADLYHYGTHLRTGDLGRMDADGYLWITGRAKDLIIRGGHNIDPAEIEDALSGHPAVAIVGAIGQPDAYAGELPCAYVELVADAEVTVDELMAHCQEHVQERAARPKYLEIMDELPKTAVGKVFKPDLRKLAIERIFNAELVKSGVDATVVSVVDCKKRGLVAQVKSPEMTTDADIEGCLGQFSSKWETHSEA